MVGLLGWLLFGLLAVLEFGDLPRARDNDWEVVLILVGGVVSVACALARVVGAARRGRASALLLPWLSSLLGLGAAWWWLQQSGAETRVTATSAAALGFFGASLALFTLGALVCALVRLRRTLAFNRRRRLSAQHERLDRAGLPIDSLPGPLG